MIMYAKLYCEKCKQVKTFVWFNPGVYVCSGCENIQELPKGYWFVTMST